MKKLDYSDSYSCSSKEGEGCNGCGNCNKSVGKIQEYHYFLFDTVCGRSALRPDFDERPEKISFDNSMDTVDFLLGFCGYKYKIEKDIERVKESIDNGVPVFASMNEASNGAFRIIIGYSGEKLIMADPGNAQKKPEKDPDYEEIKEFIIVTGKTEPRYTMLDGLKNIKTIIENTLEKGIWDDYIRRFRYFDEKLYDSDFEDIKRRIKRICDISWYNFNCHNFAETFRNRKNAYSDSLTGSIKGEEFDESCREIDQSYDNSHTKNWQIIALYECRNWDKRGYNELEWGYMGCVLQCLEKLKQYDEEVLSSVKKMINLLEK